LVLVGAGCSASAGIPTASGVVDLALKHLGRKRLRQIDVEKRDPQIIYEDLKADGIHFANKYGPELYYEIFDEHLDESNEQRAIIKEAIEQGKGKINWAHIRLGQLVAERCVHTVITTNFDRLVQEGMRRANVIAAVADGLEAFNRIDARPAFPQIIHLHGSFYNYSPRNSTRHISEVGKAAPTRGALYGLLQAAPFLLVVGYRGEEEGLMQPLREALMAFPERRVFWALHGDEDSAPTQVKSLSNTGCILTFLSNFEADDLFDILATGAQLGLPSWIRNPITSLLRDQADVVSPTRPDVEKLLRRHGEELDALSTYLSIRRTQQIIFEGDGLSNSPQQGLFYELKNALSQNEFFLEFQPIVSLNGGQIVGAEALIRWQHPTRGVLLPSEFLSIAEKTGLIADIGRWVVQSACEAASNWPQDVRISINVSPIEFRDENLRASIENIIAKTGLSPGRLELEITEETVLETSSTVIDALWQLHGLGVKIALDDFGTGYSSLSYLRRFPFDRIKIDRSFIRDIGYVEDDSIVLAIISLARSMNMNATAEGVETDEQRLLLGAWGCSEAQGFLFYRPMSAEDFLKIIKLKLKK